MALSLTRKPGESIRIGDEITVTIASVHGDNVRIRITAPSAVGIWRDEIYERAVRSGGKKNAEL